MGQLRKGFRGIVKIDGDILLRVSTVDIQRRQEAIPFLPTYAGTQLRRIWRRGTGKIAGSISFPLTKDKAHLLVPYAVDRTEFYMEVNYYGGQSKLYTGCVVENMSFTCTAGEVVTVQMNISATGVEDVTRTLGYTKGEKLVTWDKCVVDFSSAYSDSILEGFTYNIDNDIKTIHTQKQLLPTFLNPAIQNVSGKFEFYDFELPEVGTLEYSLGFKQVQFAIDTWSTTHDIVFDPTEANPLSADTIMSTVSWARTDDF